MGKPAGSGVPTPKPRRGGNFEGAFPLLLIGSVLLVYAGVIANQASASNGTHLPLWGLIGGVGAVVVGAGVYSSFLEPALPFTPDSPNDWVTVPKAEWEAVRPRRRVTAPPEPATDEPPWWEGPSDESPLPLDRLDPPKAAPRDPEGPASPRVVVPPRVALARATPKPIARSTNPPAPTPNVMPNSRGRTPSPVISPPKPSPPVLRAVPTPAIPRKGSTRELKEAISELESLVIGEFQLPPRRPQKVVPGEPPLCADCDRKLTGDVASTSCAGCGRGLCVDCALSSQYEDGDLRCIECRVRAE